MGDLDGDGDLDAIFANGATFWQQRLVLNDGTGVFTNASTQIPVTPDSTMALALGDVDGDGDLDLLAGKQSGPPGAQNRLFLNGGSGVFADATSQVPAIPTQTWAISLGDVDADGDPDAFFGNAGQSRLYLNDASGVFVDATAQLPSIVSLTVALALGDADGDGDVDAFLGNGGAQPSRLYLNDGTGSFAQSANPLTGSATCLALGDVDGDGDLDAFLGAAVDLLLNDGSGVFTDASWQVPAGPPGGTEDVALADVEEDGDLDILRVGYGNYLGYALFLNDGSSLFSDASSQLPAAWGVAYSLGVGDLDGDGDVDALIGESASANSYEPARLYLNDGSGVFIDARGPYLRGPDGTPDAALGDVDGDGDLDAVLSDRLGGLLLNDGSGAWIPNSFVPPFNGATSTQAIALGDLDGDGDLDAFCGRWGQSGHYLNNGAGGFSASPAPLPPISVATFAVALGDVDGDGDLDALLGNGGVNVAPFQQNYLYLNIGSGAFGNATIQLPVIGDNTRDLALVDLDGDGDLDLLTASLGEVRVDRNDGAGGFTNVHWFSFIPATSVAPGDVDGDGDIDALVGSVQDLLLVNDGSGSLADATPQLPALGQSTEDVALGDLDGDGDLDALLVGPGGQNAFYLNDGSGSFVDASNELDPFSGFEQHAGLALGDVDGDGDVDAVVGVGGSPDRLLTNLTRHLAWRGLPRIGKPLTLDLHGPPGGAWALGAAIATASIPVGSVGTLRLDPPSVFAVFAGSLDGLGRAAVTVAVPPDASLAGFSVYWQGMVASPLKFTNLEVTTFTEF
ncbi:MAG: VCBS repeat-containing protein [Planctomycetes bacterium]|nr:VCBS repeat-containing protein [Planctomycetota bacterium]